MITITAIFAFNSVHAQKTVNLLSFKKMSDSHLITSCDYSNLKDKGIFTNSKNENITPFSDNFDLNLRADLANQENNYKYSSLMLYSTLLPGLGLSKMEQGKPYWIMGVVGYGSVVASITSLQLAKTSYDDYLIEEDINKRAEYHDKVVKQNNTAKIFAFAAIGSWLINYSWLTIKWKNSNANAEAQNRNLNNLNFYTSYDNNIKGALFTLNYKF